MTVGPEHRIELLNRIGQTLVQSAGSRAGYPAVVREVRALLGLEAASLWVPDRTRGVPIKESLDLAPGIEWGDGDLTVDESLARWQFGHRTRRAIDPNGTDATLLPPGYARRVVALPVQHREEEIYGALNLYAGSDAPWYFAADVDPEAAEFLRSVAGQISVFIEKRVLAANTTLYKEIHHRVKNNLQTVASILQMQIRRLGTISAEQALEDSINRILAIAMVHETLSQAEIGLVNFGELVGRIGHLLASELAVSARLDLRTSGPAVMLSSREATAAALVANELISNALVHGVCPTRGGIVRVALEHLGDRVLFGVEDDGPGLRAGFDLARDGNLGLTIVATLVEEELQGMFQLSSPRGAHAQVAFPLPRSSASPGGAQAS